MSFMQIYIIIAVFYSNQETIGQVLLLFLFDLSVDQFGLCHHLFCIKQKNQMYN